MVGDFVSWEVSVCWPLDNVSGPKRAFAALWQTVLALLVLAIISVVAHQYGRIDLEPLENDAWLGVLALISGIFGATFINERASLHSKWQYLANTYTQAILMEDRAIQDHALSFLAHDILIMEMWAHKSFKQAFKDAIQESVEKCGVHLNCAPGELDRIASEGLGFRRALEMIDALNVHYDKIREAAAKKS